MIHFFRRIRQGLINKERAGKYLLYAIGEIFLVVIGILLALQINNWNEEKINDDKFKATFIEIDHNLKQTIEDADKLIEWYMRKDSLIYLVMHDKVSGEDYTNTRGLGHLITTERFLDIPQSGYDNLIEDIESLPKNYRTLADAVKTTLKSVEGIKQTESYIRASITEYIKYLNYNQSWYHKGFFLNPQLTDDQMKYFLSDFYKNAVFDYYVGFMRNYVPKISMFREDAHNVRLQIAQLFKEVSVDLPDHSNYAHMEGNYVSEEDTIIITLKNRTLYFKYNSFPESVLIPFDKSRFMAYRSWFCYFKYDEHDEVIGISERRGDNIIEYKKSK